MRGSARRGQVSEAEAQRRGPLLSGGKQFLEYKTAQIAGIFEFCLAAFRGGCRKSFVGKAFLFVCRGGVPHFSCKSLGFCTTFARDAAGIAGPGAIAGVQKWVRFCHGATKYAA